VLQDQPGLQEPSEVQVTRGQLAPRAALGLQVRRDNQALMDKSVPQDSQVRWGHLETWGNQDPPAFQVHQAHLVRLDPRVPEDHRGI
jgi:hypothetical protein